MQNTPSIFKSSTALTDNSLPAHVARIPCLHEALIAIHTTLFYSRLHFIIINYDSRLSDEKTNPNKVIVQLLKAFINDDGDPYG